MMKNTSKCHVKKDDKVKIIAGKDKGKIGKVLKVVNKKNRVLVENINIVKRHTRPSAQNRQGGIVETEAPIHWTNVMLMCSKCMSPSRIRMRQLEDGNKVRVCTKCNEVIDA
jgi:large subunit ribosomal protein L24